MSEPAVLLMGFRRAATTARVLESIRSAGTGRLYVALDGPREDVAGEAEKVNEVRRLVERENWAEETKLLYREENLGGPRACSSAISWFFEHEEQGIILEDDTLPNPDFFRFCSSLLDRYVDDQRVWAITGDNFQGGRRRGAGSYYFSKYFHTWGWATWRRAWENFDLVLQGWPHFYRSSTWTDVHPDRVERNYWAGILDGIHSGTKVHWDYAWMGKIWMNGGLTATPNANLVTNIGFGEDASNCMTSDHLHANLPTARLGEITHPEEVEVDRAADTYTFNHHFNGRHMRFPRRWVNRLAAGVRKLQSESAG